MEAENKGKPTKIIRLPAVIERVGLQRTAIYERIAEGTFPKPVPLGGHAVGWVEAEVQEWIDGRIELREAA